MKLFLSLPSYNAKSADKAGLAMREPTTLVLMVEII